MIKKYKIKPVVVEAIQFTGDNHSEVFKMCGKSVHYHEMLDNSPFIRLRKKPTEESGLDVKTTTEVAYVGDFIVKGVNGAVSFWKPDEFQRTYEEVQP